MYLHLSILLSVMYSWLLSRIWGTPPVTGPDGMVSIVVKSEDEFLGAVMTKMLLPEEFPGFAVNAQCPEKLPNTPEATSAWLNSMQVRFLGSSERVIALMESKNATLQPERTMRTLTDDLFEFFQRHSFEGDPDDSRTVSVLGLELSMPAETKKDSEDTSSSTASVRTLFVRSVHPTRFSRLFIASLEVSKLVGLVCPGAKVTRAFRSTSHTDSTGIWINFG